MSSMTTVCYSIVELDGMLLSDLLDILDPVYEIDPNARLEVRDNEIHQVTENGEIEFYQDIVIRHKDERGQ